jgi:X-X-X-Leu-X-X-Gly heptad repeat protein
MTAPFPVAAATTTPTTTAAGEGDTASATSTSSSVDTTTATTGIASREEVIYANLDAGGAVSEVYSVNKLELAGGGTVTDHGDFTAVRNLTDITPLKLESSGVAIDTKAEKFYYQGNIGVAPLPWTVSVTYRLDGRTIAPADLAGASGHLVVNIGTGQAADVDPVFYDNYMLQTTVTLDTAKCDNIVSASATFANAGADKILTFTTLPKRQGTFSFEADVEDFTMAGISIAALPYSMSIDTPDTSEMTSGLTTLTDAISQLDDGTRQLAEGSSSLASGTEQFAGGLTSFKNGLDELNSSSGALVSGSQQILDALKLISGLFGGIGNLDLSALEQFPQYLRQGADYLDSAATTLEQIDAAETALDANIQALPDAPLSAEQYAALQALIDATTDADQSASASAELDALRTAYNNAAAAKGSYVSLHDLLEESGVTVIRIVIVLRGDGTDANPGLANLLRKGADELEASMQDFDSSSINDMISGIASFSGSYQAFHDGLVSYTNGVDSLASNFTQLDNNGATLAAGARTLSSGVWQLASGTGQLAEQTRRIPEEVEKQVDSMMAEYQPADFTPVSYLSSLNKNTKSVQFVMQTAAIAKPKVDVPTDQTATELTIWDRLLALFAF